MLCSSVAVVSELMALLGRKSFSPEAMESQELGYSASTRVVSVYGNGLPVYRVVRGHPTATRPIIIMRTPTHL